MSQGYDSGEAIAPLIRNALYEVTNRFSETMIESSLATAWRPGDYFGSLASQSYNTFMALGHSHLTEAGDKISAEAKTKIEEKFDVSVIGLGATAIFIELVPLIYARDFLDYELDADEAAQTATNSFDFIEQAIEQGSVSGKGIVQRYLLPGDFSGTVINGQLVVPERLEGFGLTETTDGTDLRLTPVDLEAALKQSKQETEQLRALGDEAAADGRVNCTAHIYKNPDNGERYTRLLFDAMVEHTRLHIYPTYIPLARSLFTNSDQ